MPDLSSLSDEQLEVYRDLLSKGTEKAPKVNPPKPSFGDKLEETISPTSGEDNFLTSPHGLIRTGLRQAVHGAREMFTPGQRMQGASDVIRGGLRVASPAAVPFIVSNPVGAALGVGAGMAGGTAAKLGTQALGGGEGAQNLAEDIGGLSAGAYGVKSPNLTRAIKTGIKVGGPEVGAGAAMIGAGEGISKTFGMSTPVHYMLDYPGARTMYSGFRRGLNAGKAEFNNRPIAGPVKSPVTNNEGNLNLGVKAPRGQEVEFKVNSPVLPQSGLKPKGTPDNPLPHEVIKPGTQPPGESLLESKVTDPRISRASVQKHLENISNKENVIRAFAEHHSKTGENPLTIKELEGVKYGLEQADNPELFHEAKIATDAYKKDLLSFAREKGMPAPKDKYKSFGVEDLEVAIKHLKQLEHD